VDVRLCYVYIFVNGVVMVETAEGRVTVRSGNDTSTVHILVFSWTESEIGKFIELGESLFTQ